MRGMSSVEDDVICHNSCHHTVMDQCLLYFPIWNWCACFCVSVHACVSVCVRANVFMIALYSCACPQVCVCVSLCLCACVYTATKRIHVGDPMPNVHTPQTRAHFPNQPQGSSPPTKTVQRRRSVPPVCFCCLCETPAQPP